MSDIWSELTTFLAENPYLEALAIVLGFIVVAYLTDRLLTGTLRRLVARSETRFDDQLIDLIHRPIFITVALIGITLVASRLGLSDSIGRAVVVFVQTALVVVWVTFAIRFSRLSLRAMSRSSRRFQIVQRSTEPVLANATAIVFFIVGVYTILAIWDVNVTGLVASAGILGLVIGLAAQDTLSNLFAGVAILSDRPYEIGDYIILDTGERGEVTRIGLRSTRLLTRDDVEITIPNGVMGASKIVNEAGGPRQYRIRALVGVAYGSDIDKVGDILIDVGRNHPKTLRSPEPTARFVGFGASSLDFELQTWIERPADRGLVLHDLNTEIYTRFGREDITIPFPQQDLYIKKLPDRSGPPSED